MYAHPCPFRGIPIAQELGSDGSSCRPYRALPALPESAQVGPAPAAGRTKKRKLSECCLKSCAYSSKSPSGLQGLQSCFQGNNKKPEGDAGRSSPRSCRFAGISISTGLEGKLWSWGVSVGLMRCTDLRGLAWGLQGCGECVCVCIWPAESHCWGGGRDVCFSNIVGYSPRCGWVVCYPLCYLLVV